MISLILAILLATMRGDQPAPTKMSGATIAQVSGAVSMLYVDPTGSDINGCTASGASACLTLQEAANRCPQILDASNTASAFQCVINVAAGSYSGDVTIKGRSQRAHQSASSIQIVGPAQVVQTNGGPYASGSFTVQTVDPDTGLSDGNRTITVTASPVWTVDQWVGYLITNGTSTFTIASNTANVIEFVTNTSTFGAGDTLSIVAPGATITGRVTLSGNDGNVDFNDLKITNATQPIDVFSGYQSYFSEIATFRRSMISTTAVGAQSMILNGSTRFINSSVDGAGFLTASIGLGSYIFSNSTLWYRTLLSGNPGYLTMNGSTIRAQPAGGSYLAGGLLNGPPRKILKPLSSFTLDSFRGQEAPSASFTIAIVEPTNTVSGVLVIQLSTINFYGFSIKGGGAPVVNIANGSYVRLNGAVTTIANAVGTAITISGYSTVWADGAWTGSPAGGGYGVGLTSGGKLIYTGAQPTITGGAGIDGATYAWTDTPASNVDSGTGVFAVSGQNTSSRVQFRTGFSFPPCTNNSGTGTTTLTSASTYCQLCTPGGVVTRTFTLPACTSVNEGLSFSIMSHDTTGGTCTVTRSGADTIFTTTAGNTSSTWLVATGTKHLYTCYSAATEWEESQ